MYSILLKDNSFGGPGAAKALDSNQFNGFNSTNNKNNDSNAPKALRGAVNKNFNYFNNKNEISIVYDGNNKLLLEKDIVGSAGAANAPELLF